MERGQKYKNYTPIRFNIIDKIKITVRVYIVTNFDFINI